MSIYAYNPASNSANLLAKRLGVKRIKHKNSRFRGWAGKSVINWGCSNLPEQVNNCYVLNEENAVALASNKAFTFRTINSYNESVTEDDKINIPLFTSRKDEAVQWLIDDKRVFVRHKLTGHSGEGIDILKGAVEVPDAPLYVQGVPKDQEYRVHVLNGNTFVQRKARRKEVPDEEVNWAIRNHSNGFIFANDQDNIGDVPENLLETAIAVIRILGLHFGAVDLVTERKTGKVYVLEVNTACGLSGKTLDFYVDNFKEML